MEECLDEAVRQGNIGKVLDIIHSGKLQKLPLEEIPEDSNVLHLAAILGHVACARLLTQTHPACVNSPDSLGWVPLMHAVHHNNYDTAALLLDSGLCDVNARDNFQQTALHVQAQSSHGSVAMAELLLRHNVHLNAEDSEGMTPFLRAIESDTRAVADCLYRTHCAINSCSQTGRGPLHLACYHGKEDMVTWLLSIGCSVNALDNQFQTPLQVCVQQRRPPHVTYRIMRRLLHAGSAVDNPDYQAVYDGLHYPDRLRILAQFLRENCYPDMACRGKLLFTSGVDSVYCYENFLLPLQVALESGLHEAARLLLSAGCHVPPEVRCEILAGEGRPELAWLRQRVMNPWPLLHQCRVVIRTLLGCPILSKTAQLPLPHTLRQMLTLDDLVSCDQPAGV